VNPLNGVNRYRMHFEKTSLPPVRAFWSVTAYDQGGYFISNPIESLCDWRSRCFEIESVAGSLNVAKIAIAGKSDTGISPASLFVEGSRGLSLSL